MSTKSRTAGRALIASLLLCAFVGAARAQEPPVPNTEDAKREEERALAERRQAMIDDCEQNHGSEIDCVRETDTELRAEGLRVGARVIHLRPAR